MPDDDKTTEGVQVGGRTRIRIIGSADKCIFCGAVIIIRASKSNTACRKCLKDLHEAVNRSKAKAE